MASINKISFGKNVNTNPEKSLADIVPYSSDDEFYIKSVKKIEKANASMERTIKIDLFFFNIGNKLKQFLFKK